MSTITGLVFPGQGSQTLNMGKDLYETNPKAKEIMDLADNQLSFGLIDLVFGKDEEKLKETRYAQPALYTVSAMFLEIIRDKGIEPAVCAGHSLGEYAALYAAGFFDFETGLSLVEQRGAFMSDMVEPGLGMTAVIGLATEVIEEIVEKYPNVYIANLNSRGQIVISGTLEELKECQKDLDEAEAMSIVPLKVSSAFHSPYMQPVAEKMAPLIENAAVKDTSIPVLPNANPVATRDAAILKKTLVDQITGKVQWIATVEYMAETMGVELCYETGPGKVLAGLSKRITRSLKCKSAQTLLTE